MALPASGSISLLQIATEFGGAAPHSISEYRGSGGTPATGPISWSDFHGKSAVTVNIVGANPSSFGGTVATATSRYTLNSTGSETFKEGGAAAVSVGTWLLSGAASAYEVMATHTGGSAPTTGTLNTWLNMGTTREWTYAAPVNVVGSSTLSISIRPAGGGATLDTATVNLYSERY